MSRRAQKVAAAVRELEAARTALRRAQESIATGDLRWMDQPVARALAEVEYVLGMAEVKYVQGTRAES
jgi:hypothetical protein